jgi:hypothetical protein
MNIENLFEFNKSESYLLKHDYKKYVRINEEKDKKIAEEKGEKKPWFPSCPDRW